MRNWIALFIASFALNFVWESFHSLFYVHYLGGPITYFILARAAIFDAFIILALAYVLRGLASKGVVVLLVVTCTFFSVLLEIWALGLGRWAYNAYMPLLPFINVGLTPALQLGITSYIAYNMAGFKNSGSRVE